MSDSTSTIEDIKLSGSNIPNTPRTEVINSEEDRYDRKNSKSLAKRERKALSYTNQRITTRAQLKDYIVDTLGYPLQTVELTDEQLEDCIDDATQLYTKWATLPEKYITKLTQPALSKNAPANRAITGSLAPQGMKGASIAVARRSRSLRMVRQAIMPGIAQPVPMTMGITDLPDSPTFLKMGSSTTVARAI